MPRTPAIDPDQFATFGELLKYLRRRAGLTQRELSIGVGYSESQISRLEQNQRPPDEASLAEESVRICRALGPAGTWDLAHSLLWDGLVAYWAGDDAGARARAEECRPLYQLSGDIWEVAQPSDILGFIASRQGDYVAAHALFEESLLLMRELEDIWGIALTVDWLAATDRIVGDYEAARAHSQENLRLWCTFGRKWDIAKYLHILAIAALHQGDYELARALLLESLAPLRESLLTADAAGYSPDTSDYSAVALTLVGYSALARARGQWFRAARLLRGAESLVMSSTSVHGINDIGEIADRIEYERLVSARRGHIQDEALAAAWIDGQAMPLEQAIAYTSEDNVAL